MKKGLVNDINSFKIGPTEDFSNFVNAVIDEKSFDKLAKYIDDAKRARTLKWWSAAPTTKQGWYIHPTVLLAKDPKYVTMCEELFGPVPRSMCTKTRSTSRHFRLSTRPAPMPSPALSSRRIAMPSTLAMRKLTHAAGNFYISDKCTGAVVGQQPFGGAALRVRTTRRVPSSTCCAGFRPRHQETFVPRRIIATLPPGRKRQR